MDKIVYIVLAVYGDLSSLQDSLWVFDNKSSADYQYEQILQSVHRVGQNHAMKILRLYAVPVVSSPSR